MEEKQYLVTKIKGTIVSLRVTAPYSPWMVTKSFGKANYISLKVLLRKVQKGKVRTPTIQRRVLEEVEDIDVSKLPEMVATIEREHPEFLL